MRTTVVITVYNRVELLGSCLRSLQGQSARIDEVVVSDDGSREDVLGALRGWTKGSAFRVRYVRQDDRGFRLAACRNNGIRAATGDLVVFADQDLVFTRDYVKTFVDASRPGTFLVSWPVRLTREQTAQLGDREVRSADYSALVTPEQEASVERQYRKDRFYFWMHRLGLREIGPKLRGGVCAFQKADLARVNGYDEQYQGWGNEDDDLGRRLHRAGVKGLNPFRSDYAVHLYHEPFKPDGVRPNLAYYEARVREIRRGECRCRHGLDEPLSPEEVAVTDLS